MAFSTLEQLLL